MKLDTIAPHDWETRSFPAWSKLLEEVSEPSLFLSSEWISAWCRLNGLIGYSEVLGIVG